MIRKAKIEDLNYINRLGIIIDDNFPNTYNIESYINNSHYIILLNDDELINGLLIIYQNIDYYELEAIVVDSEYRNQKIASNLLEYFITNYCKTGDIILLEVAVNNYSALNLYKKFHFNIINTRKKYYKNLDAYVMKKVI